MEGGLSAEDKQWIKDEVKLQWEKIMKPWIKEEIRLQLSRNSAQ
jgi:hypothetical protein